MGIPEHLLEIDMSIYPSAQKYPIIPLATLEMVRGCYNVQGRVSCKPVFLKSWQLGHEAALSPPHERLTSLS